MAYTKSVALEVGHKDPYVATSCLKGRQQT